MTDRQRFTGKLVALLAIGALVLSGCAAHQDASTQSPTTALPVDSSFPVTVTPAGAKPVTLKARPHKIVSLSPTDTETLFAIGAGDQVVAADKLSDYPTNAPHTKLDASQPNVEAIAGYNPDLVIINNDTNGLLAALQKVHIPVLLLSAPKTLDDAYAQWQLLGKATGHADQANDEVTKTKDQISKIVADTKKPAKPLSYYYELDQTYYTATSKTFIGSVFNLFGLRNIGDSADTGSAGGYPQLSAEQVVNANPDLIFLADTKCCQQSAQSVAKRAGWGTLKAVSGGHVIGLDDDIASRWSPRIVDLVRQVSDAVDKAAK
ncbi:MAG: ABC transporter substrate-binding protein [Sciscionella sp.]|nr:ABC transporter substrate-binding protein [Sciscionella sp.]